MKMTIPSELKYNFITKLLFVNELLVRTSLWTKEILNFNVHSNINCYWMKRFVHSSICPIGWTLQLLVCFSATFLFLRTSLCHFYSVSCKKPNLQTSHPFCCVTFLLYNSIKKFRHKSHFVNWKRNFQVRKPKHFHFYCVATKERKKKTRNVNKRLSWNVNQASIAFSLLNWLLNCSFSLLIPWLLRWKQNEKPIGARGSKLLTMTR